MEDNARNVLTFRNMKPGRKLWPSSDFSYDEFHEMAPVFFVGFDEYSKKVHISYKAEPEKPDNVLYLSQLFTSRKAMLQNVLQEAKELVEDARTRLEKVEAQYGKIQRGAK